VSELKAPEGLVHLGSGKVRDLYEVDDDHLLLVASDRISASTWSWTTRSPARARC
jgi:phosphoribosylaminoimidazole-succinocarboxamide synthase